MAQRITKSTTRTQPPLDLVGCCFIIWGDGGEWQFQGWIRSRPEPGLYLCQYFDGFGDEGDITIFPIEKMAVRPHALAAQCFAYGELKGSPSPACAG
jgi:hypothetical protein